MRFLRFITPYLCIVVLLVLFIPNYSNAENYAWKSLGPYGGVISAPVVDPAERLTIYAGTAKSGVFKNVNTRGTWNAINNGLSNLYVGSLAIDSINPSIVYAGVPGGVCRSTDGSRTWTSTDSLPNLSAFSTALLRGDAVLHCVFDKIEDRKRRHLGILQVFRHLDPPSQNAPEAHFFNPSVIPNHCWFLPQRN